MVQKIFKNFTFNPKDDILSGLTVALALVPEAVAFSFVAGIDPLVGLYGAFLLGIMNSLAILIFLSLLDMFKDKVNGVSEWIYGNAL